MDQPSFPAILTHTPRWVFVIFAALLALGCHQSRDRKVSRGRLLILPVAMLGFSLFGAVSSFGVSLLPLLAWSLGVGAVVIPAAWRLPVSSKTSDAILVKGSWWPFVLMMGIFLIKYVTGYALARNLAIAFQPWFVGAVSASLGLLSGVFTARARAAWAQV